MLLHLPHPLLRRVAIAAGAQSSCSLCRAAPAISGIVDGDDERVWASLLENELGLSDVAKPPQGWRDGFALEWANWHGWSLWAILQRADGPAAVRRAVAVWRRTARTIDDDLPALREDFDKILAYLCRIDRPVGRAFREAAAPNPCRITVQPSAEKWPESAEELRQQPRDERKLYEISTNTYNALQPAIAGAFLLTDLCFLRRPLHHMPWQEVGPHGFARPIDPTGLLADILWELATSGGRHFDPDRDAAHIIGPLDWGRIVEDPGMREDDKKEGLPWVTAVGEVVVQAPRVDPSKPDDHAKLEDVLVAAATEFAEGSRPCTWEHWQKNRISNRHTLPPQCRLGSADAPLVFSGEGNVWPSGELRTGGAAAKAMPKLKISPKSGKGVSVSVLCVVDEDWPPECCD